MVYPSFKEMAKKGKPYPQWQAERDGRPTWRTAIRMDIREAVQESFTWKQFLAQMEQKGYVWKLDQKYPALKALGMERFVRLKSLGTNYTEDKIQEWLLKPKRTGQARSGISGWNREQNQKQGRKETAPKRKLTSLQALYYSYLYQMGVLKKRPQNLLSGEGGYPAVEQTDRADGISAKTWDHNPRSVGRIPGSQRKTG